MTRLIPLREVESLVGQEVGVSGWHVVSQEQINLFAQTTGDFESLHVDVERATREMGDAAARHATKRKKSVAFL